MNEIMNTSREQLAVNRLDALAAEIRGFTASLLSSVIEIGRRFHEAKELLPYGEFGDWAREETGYSVSTVNNYMRLFEEYGDRQGSLFGASLDSQTFGKLTYSKALALLAIEDKTEREAFVEDHDVDSMSTRELQQALRERDEARAEAKHAEESRAKMEQDMKAANEQLEAAMGRISEIENSPKEVAVEKVVDQEAIDAAVAKAKEEAQKKIEAAEKARETAERKLQKAEEKAKAAETKAADAGKGAGEELTRAKAEAKAAREEAEGLRKQLAMSDAAVTAFKVMFQQWQGDYQKMVDTFGTMDEETREKLRAAIRAQIEAWGWGKEDA